MFYTNLTAYPYIPDRNKITDMIAEGYTVMINDNGKYPTTSNQLKVLRLKNLTTSNIRYFYGGSEISK